MNIDPIIPSILHVTACEIDVTDDLNKISTKTIAELLDEEKEKNTQPPQEN